MAKRLKTRHAFVATPHLLKKSVKRKIRYHVVAGHPAPGTRHLVFRHPAPGTRHLVKERAKAMLLATNLGNTSQCLAMGYAQMETKMKLPWVSWEKWEKCFLERFFG